jgi:cation:H+ antiporter
MSNVLWIPIWLGFVVGGVLAMQWGVNRACPILVGLRSRFGLSAAAGGAFMGLATASPEISVNLASVALGWPDLGLGAALGSNVPALPLIFAVSYLSRRFAAGPEHLSHPPPPRVQPDAVPVQVVPYLIVLALLAVLTLFPGQEGLQPIDGLVLAAAFGVYLAYILRQRQPAPEKRRGPPGYGRALLGIPAIGLGAVASVVGARHVTDALGISDLIGGLFVIGLLCALPESFAAWRLTREGRTTSAVSGAVADGIVSLTLALVPPALVGTTVGNGGIYALNLAFLFLALAGYAVMNHRNRGQELGLVRVALYVCAYCAYLVATVRVLVS